MAQCDVRVWKLRNVALNRIVQLQASVALQCQQQGGGECFREGSSIGRRVGSERDASLDICGAESLFVENRAVVADDDRPIEKTALMQIPEQRINPRRGALRLAVGRTAPDHDRESRADGEASCDSYDV